MSIVYLPLYSSLIVSLLVILIPEETKLFPMVSSRLSMQTLNRLICKISGKVPLGIGLLGPIVLQCLAVMVILGSLVPTVNAWRCVYPEKTPGLVVGLLILLLTTGITTVTLWWLWQWLRHLKQGVQGLSQNLASLPLDLEVKGELGEVVKAINQMGKRLHQSVTHLEAQNADWQRLDQLKDEFLANTSHQLRMPLNGMVGLAESLMDGAAGPLSPRVQANLALMVASGRRLSNLVNDILDFSQLKHEDIELDLKPVGVREIAEVVLTLSQPMIGAKDLQLINNISVDLPLVNADENRLQQILYNLVENAIKFTQSGRVEISATLIPSDEVPGTNYADLMGETFDKNANLESVEFTSLLAITVSDTGIGIPEHKLEQIFQFLEYTHPDHNRAYPGISLGLAITKKLVELHGGEISVQSVLEQGTQFTFTLPVTDSLILEPSESSLQKSIPVLSSNGESFAHLKDLLSSNVYPRHLLPDLAIWKPDIQGYNGQSSNPFKILIVDDDPVNLQILVNYLSLQNYALTPATNGSQALQLIEQGLEPDLILLDVMMPKMTGYEVCRKLREYFPANELPILILPDKNQVSDLVEALGAGANDYLTKPISKNELLARIKTHLQLAKINQAYSRFVPREFLQFLGKESIVDVQLGDQVQKEMSILFSDIRAFTTLSERMTPEENFRFINSYLSSMEPAITANQGFIDKYIGDAIMALFGGAADDAVKAGIAMMQQLYDYNQGRQRAGYLPVQIGIGINTGSLMLGTVGGHSRMDSTVISDAVNLASRIEELTKNYGVSLLISNHTFLKLQNPFDYDTRIIDRVKVKGKSELVTVYEVFEADPPHIREGKLLTKTTFEEAWLLYNINAFENSAKLFQECLRQNPSDTAAQIYLVRCEEHLKNS